MKLHRAVLLVASFAGVPCFAQGDEAGDESRAVDAVDAVDAIDAVDAVEFDAEPLDCVSTPRINRTTVIDDQTIAFYMRGGDVLVNSMPRRCPGLGRADRFMYEVRMSRLCSSDTITVLERFGTEFQRGFTCRLGVYHPSTEDAVALLVEATEAGGSSPSVTVTPVDPPGEAADAAPGDDAASDTTEPAANE